MKRLSLITLLLAIATFNMGNTGCQQRNQGTEIGSDGSGFQPENQNGDTYPAIQFVAKETIPIFVENIEYNEFDGWEQTGCDNSLTPEASGFALVSLAVIFGDARLMGAGLTQVECKNAHSHYVYGHDLDLKSYALTGRVMPDRLTNHFGITVLSQYPDSDRYHILTSENGKMNFYKHENGHRTLCNQQVGEIHLEQDSSKWHNFKIEVLEMESGSLLRAQAWPRDSGQGEPNGWQLKCKAEADSGTVGLWNSKSSQANPELTFFMDFTLTTLEVQK